MRAYSKRIQRLLLVAMFCAGLWTVDASTAARLGAQQPEETGLEALGQDAPAMEDVTLEPAADEAAPADEATPPDAMEGDEDEAEKKPKATSKPRPKRPVFDTESGDNAPTDPAVLAILESHPKSPAELLRATNILADLGYANLAKQFVDELGQRKLDVPAKAALVKAFNPATLLKLTRDKELGAVLAPMIDDWLAAAESYRRDPARLAAAAKQLGDPSEATRAQATLALVQAREAAVAPLVALLADPNQIAIHGVAKEVLVYLGDVAVAPLLGVLESPDAALKTHVIDVLGRIRTTEAVPQLLAALVGPAGPTTMQAAAGRALAQITGRVPSPSDALVLLEQAAREPLNQSRNESADSAVPTVVWHWNSKKHESMPIEYDATGAALAKASRLARALHLVDPANAARRRLYLTAMLQAAKFRGGLEKPLAAGDGTAYAVAAYYGPDILDDVLARAMADGYIPAATAAAQILGDLGSAELLVRGGADPSPLARAAQHTDRRLRFAAVNSIMKLGPSDPFAGSSHVVDGLGFFARSYGLPRVLIVHPRSEEAQSMAGLAAALGFEADVATNGRRAFELAVASPDYEFVLIHSAIDRPRADELVAQLRRDRRTAELPIGLIAVLDDFGRIEQFARNSKRVEAVLQPRSDAEMKMVSGLVLSRAGRFRVSATERRAQANAALDWLVALAARPSRVYDLARQEPAVEAVLYVPELGARAATVLGELGTAKGQRRLIELADSATQPLATRQAAAAAFARSVERHGMALSGDEIMEQYEMYNANGGRNGDTHTVLTAILDAIEQKSNSQGGP